MVGCVEGILGLRPDMDGLRIAPSVPAGWSGFTMEKTFRGRKLRIQIKNSGCKGEQDAKPPTSSGSKQGGCGRLTVNGNVMGGDYIPASILKEENDIVVEM
jgi:cellobiose phosphorylase